MVKTFLINPLKVIEKLLKVLKRLLLVKEMIITRCFLDYTYFKKVIR